MQNPAIHSAHRMRGTWTHRVPRVHVRPRSHVAMTSTSWTSGRGSWRSRVTTWLAAVRDLAKSITPAAG
jgi:hypothetical protein